MDYEKKYNDALADMKVIYPNLKGDAKKAVEHAFPELKEGEDERIRKALLRCCDDWEKGQFGCMAKEDVPAIRAYLEKQKEQKPVTIVRIPKFRVGDIIQHIPLEKWDSTKKITSIGEHGYNYNLSHLGDTVSGGAIGFAFKDEYELVEQKPAEDKDAIEPIPKQDYSGLTDFERAIHRGFLCAGVENVPVGIIKDTAQDCLTLIEQKPAWSEEDKANLDNIIWLCENCEKGIENVWIPSQATQIKNLIKSLRPQPKQEWSEEDEGILLECISALQNSSHWLLADKLKSLRPQSHWKPSEEQMLALGGVLDYLEESNNEDADIIRELINDLKKL